jgi:hypothetical protein
VELEFVPEFLVDRSADGIVNGLQEALHWTNTALLLQKLPLRLLRELCPFNRDECSGNAIDFALGLVQSYLIG